MKHELDLGPDVVMLLLPHRRPFLFVDRVASFEAGRRPVLRASRFISANEPVFAGHFPHLSVWPGVYTIEGMGQSSNILAVLDFVSKGLGERGGNPARLFALLRNLELGKRLHPGYRPEEAADLDEIFKVALPNPSTAMGMSAAVDVKLLTPVFAGQRLDYVVTLTHVMDRLLRYEVRAEVEGREVAKGIMTGSFGYG